MCKTKIDLFPPFHLHPNLCLFLFPPPHSGVVATRRPWFLSWFACLIFFFKHLLSRTFMVNILFCSPYANQRSPLHTFFTAAGLTMQNVCKATWGGKSGLWSKKRAQMATGFSLSPRIKKTKHKSTLTLWLMLRWREDGGKATEKPTIRSKRNN